MKCVLHIGTEKTGTTSIQMTMTDSTDALTAAGFFYPDLLSGQEHSRISSFAMDDERMDRRKLRMGLTDAESILTFRSDFERRLGAEVDEARGRGAHTAIIVNEHLSRLMRASEVVRLRTLLEAVFDSVEVHVYLRRQDKLMRSMYSTIVRVGDTRQRVFPLPGETRDFELFDYERILKLWRSVFPPEQLHVHRFESGALLEGDVIRDFVHAADPEGKIDVDALRVSRQNVSVEPEALEALRLLNVALENTENSRRGILGRIFGMLFPGSGARISQGEARAFLSEFESSNRWVATEVLGREELFDESDIADLPESVPDIALSNEQLAGYFAAAWSERVRQRSKRRPAQQIPAAPPGFVGGRRRQLLLLGGALTCGLLGAGICALLLQS